MPPEFRLIRIQNQVQKQEEIWKKKILTQLDLALSAMSFYDCGKLESHSSLFNLDCNQILIQISINILILGKKCHNSKAKNELRGLSIQDKMKVKVQKCRDEEKPHAVHYDHCILGKSNQAGYVLFPFAWITTKTTSQLSLISSSCK